mmetsp:Transcript_50619/g.120763  ORF Transcript_50619/g.120763 Transcript_50619/m.120763 type:complete len:91 (-) Transcript_50619:2722-2994(-)
MRVAGEQSLLLLGTCWHIVLPGRRKLGLPAYDLFWQLPIPSLWIDIERDWKMRMMVFGPLLWMVPVLSCDQLHPSLQRSLSPPIARNCFR